MANPRFTVIEDGEPRGDEYGEPRADGFNLVVVDGEPKYWQHPDGQRTCGAKKRSWDEDYARCSRRGNLMENNRCQQHGGPSPKGYASPHFEHGRHSQYLPGQLGERLDEFLSDPEIASVRQELALIDTRLSVKLQEMDGGPSQQHWEDLEETVDELEAARRRGDGDAVAACINRIVRLVREGAEEQDQWDEIFDVVEQRRKLAETENKRMKASSNTLTVEEASMLVDAMTSTVMDILERYDAPDEAYRELTDVTTNLLDSRSS